MNAILKYFMGGLLILIPVIVLYQVVQIVASITHNFFPELNTLLAFIISFFIISLLGYLVTKRITRSIKKSVRKKSKKEGVFSFIFKIILNLKSFSAKTKDAFKNPVYFEVSPGIEKIGFITNEDVVFLENESSEHKKITVYAPNPINFFGELLIIEKSGIKIIAEEEKKNIPVLLFTAGIFEKIK